MAGCTTFVSFVNVPIKEIIDWDMGRTNVHRFSVHHLPLFEGLRHVYAPCGSIKCDPCHRETMQRYLEKRQIDIKYQMV